MIAGKKSKLELLEECLNRREKDFKKSGKIVLPEPTEEVAQVKTPKITELDLERAICRKSFFQFVKTFWGAAIQQAPKWNWHIEYLCNLLQEMAERVIAGQVRLHDLCVNISPGTTKSTIMSVMFPAWLWTRMPECRVICVSYSEKLALSLSLKTRDVVQSERYVACFPEIAWRDDQNTKTHFQNTKGGWRYAAGVNGSVLGLHAHVIVIDDPIDPEEANSEAELKTANRWIRETLSSRKVDKAVSVTILVMQRLHEDDPTAQFIRNKKVKHVCLPAEVTDDISPPELRSYYKDGLMDPVRLTKDVLDDIRNSPDGGERLYATQYLQKPVPPGGEMFKTDRIHYGVPPKLVAMVRYWDKAGTKGGGAFTVGTKMGLDDRGTFWVLDVIRVQLDSYARERLIEDTADRDGYDVKIGIEQEPGSGGKESAENTVRRLAGYYVRVDKVDVSTGGKIQRADPWSVQVNGGNVRLLRADWNHAWVEEHRFFPYSKFKDQVDSASGGFAMLHKKRVKVGALR